jgi:hypothetical protein
MPKARVQIAGEQATMTNDQGPMTKVQSLMPDQRVRDRAGLEAHRTPLHHWSLVIGHWSFLAAALISTVGASSAFAQFQEGGDPKGPKLGEAQVQRWQFGLLVQTPSGPARDMIGYVPLPSEWPEQQLAVVGEEVSPGVHTGYETVDGTVKVMIVKIAQLPAGSEAKALVTYEIRRHVLLPPDKTDIYVLPDPKKLPKTVRPYLMASPMIEVKNAKVKAALKEVKGDFPSAWKRVEAIYEYVRGRVEFRKGAVRGAVAALRDGAGGEEDLTSLFIALCRTADIPARTVWVPSHCYPEFYLEDDEGKGHWFPCEMTASRSFGGIAEHRPVIEKGDNFHPPYARRDRQRFLSEYFTGVGQAKPRFYRVPAVE